MSVVVLASGRGSNLQALFSAIDEGLCAAKIVAVVSDRSTALALELASRRGIPTEVVSSKLFASRNEWDEALAETIAKYDPSLIVLAGFMRIIGKPCLKRFPSRIINVHPALLPGFPGMDGPAQAIRAGVRVSGCTVHVVDAGVDTGPIIAQAPVPVLPDDDENDLHRRIQTREHVLLPKVVDWVVKGVIDLGPPIRLTQQPTAPELPILPALTP